MKLKKIKINSLQFLLAGIIFIFMLSASVSAFAVGFQSNDLQLHPGETYDTAFSLQNYGSGSSDITVEATIEEGTEYVTFPEGNQFVVRANGNVAAPIRVIIPSNAKEGDSYPVKILFRVISGNAGGSETESGGTTVAFAFSYRKEINLKIIPETQTPAEEAEGTVKTISAMTVILALAIIVVLVIILWLVIKKKKPTQSKKR